MATRSLPRLGYILAVWAAVGALVIGIAATARGSAPAGTDIVWWDDFKRERVAAVMQVLESAVGDDELLEPIFTPPRPVPTTPAALGYQWPVRDASEITSSYGARRDPVGGGAQFHHGIDIRCAQGEPIHAANDGTVLGVGASRIYGTSITLGHTYGFTTLYGHLSSAGVSNGERVRAGQVIGTCGSTGRATGAHLHFELRHGAGRYNPLPFLG